MNAERPPRRRWFRKRGIDLADLGVNSFAAFLGVFLALMVQNWTSDRQNSQKIEQARSAIKQELEANRHQVAEQDLYYRDFMKSAEGTSITTRGLGCNKVDAWRGFRLGVMLHSGYDTAIATGAFAQMDFNESHRIARVYAEQSSFSDLGLRMVDYYAQSFSQMDMPCAALFSDLQKNSSGLLGAYDTYLGPAQK